MPDVADTVKETGEAVAKLSEPSIFPAAIAILMLLLIGSLLFAFRSDWREERVAQNKLTERIVDKLDDMHDHLLDLGSQKSERDKRADAETIRRAEDVRRAVNASSVGN